MPRLPHPLRLPLLLLAVAAGCAATAAAQQEPPGEPWPLRVIDDTSRGADGARLADLNGDGLPDITTGWEEGGVVRVYLNPGPERARDPWPRATVGRVGSPEDAVFLPLAGLARLAVLSSCEGRTRSHFLHWQGDSSADPLDESAWSTAPIPATAGRQWMFALPLPAGPGESASVLVGAKGEKAEVGLLEPGEDPLRVAAWGYRPLRPAGWIMSLQWADFNRDGRPDLLLSDRYGPRRGVSWLEQPAEPGGAWREHRLGLAGREAMFLAQGDLTGDGRREIACAVKTPRQAIVLLRAPRPGAAGAPEEGPWEEREIPLPAGFGTAKGVAIGDLDGDGRADLAFSCEQAEGKLHGVGWLRAPADPWRGDWEPRTVSGSRGVKFDRLELLDLNGDGRLDLLTCEERAGLGVLWYENPAR